MEEFIPQTQARGSIVPNFIFYNKELSVGAKMLFTTLGSYARSKSYCYPSLKTLAGILSCSINTVKAWLNQLSQQGFVKMSSKENRISFYLFAPSKTDEQPSKIDDQPSKIDTEVNVNNLNIINNTPHTPHTNQRPPVKEEINGRGSFDINGYFEKLWNIYPRKEAKESARKVFCDLSGMEKLPSFDEIKFAIQSFYQTNAWQRENGRFIPQLVNFLRGKRWQDVDWKDVEKKNSAELRGSLSLDSPKPYIALVHDKKHEEKSTIAQIGCLLDTAWKNFKKYFKTPKKEEEALAFVLFSKCYGQIPQITSFQSISIIDYLKTIKTKGVEIDTHST